MSRIKRSGLWILEEEMNNPKFYRGIPRSIVALGLVVLLSASHALAQSVAEVAAYDGPDRMERLVAGAKKEGTLTLYTATPVDDVNQVIAAFTAKYGIPVTLWRGSSEDVLRRAITEIKGGRHDVDVIEMSIGIVTGPRIGSQKEPLLLVASGQRA